MELLVASLCQSIVEKQDTFSEAVFHKLVADLLLQVRGEGRRGTGREGAVLGLVVRRGP